MPSGPGRLKTNPIAVFTFHNSFFRELNLISKTVFYLPGCIYKPVVAFLNKPSPFFLLIIDLSEKNLPVFATDANNPGWFTRPKPCPGCSFV
jgi:hypothetical protein